MTILLMIFLWLVLGYIGSCLMERCFHEHEEDDFIFFIITIIGPFALVGCCIIGFINLIENLPKKNKASKLREWIRGF